MHKQMPFVQKSKVKRCGETDEVTKQTDRPFSVEPVWYVLSNNSTCYFSTIYNILIKNKKNLTIFPLLNSTPWALVHHISHKGSSPVRIRKNTVIFNNVMKSTVNFFIQLKLKLIYLLTPSFFFATQQFIHYSSSTACLRYHYITQ